ncbi:MAG TPA: GTP-binding protein [Terriglobia bacterium]|nr:GTP-binding protein [Terriglobia bacterium]
MIPSTSQFHHDDLAIVVVGHVDHGKSTIIGRLLADTDSLPTGKLEQVREYCRRNSRPFEYAFLLDALKEEQAQGITIETARCFFRTARRNYLILDAPGHIEFLKNMVTGASRAQAALLVIDAVEGVQENSRRHATMLSLLGIRQVIGLVNKMDLTGYDRARFDEIVKEIAAFMEQLQIFPQVYIPVSGREGDNIAHTSHKTSWYRGPTVVEVLDQFQPEKPSEEKPFRMPVQGIYRFTQDGDNRRIIAGTVASGKISAGAELTFHPSGKSGSVNSIEVVTQDPDVPVRAGYPTGFTLKEQIYITRGEIAACTRDQAPQVSSRLKTSLFWLGRSSLTKDKEYFIKLGTAKVKARVEEIRKVLNASNLHSQSKMTIERNEVGECIWILEKAIAFDLGEIPETSRFVVIDNYEISGGGTVLEALEDQQGAIREKVFLRNSKWEKSSITPEERAIKYGQKSALILITGPKDSGKKPIARALEKRLFEEGRLVYFLGIGSVLYGVDADIKGSKVNNREEHIRRLAEVSHVLLEMGAILIVTAVELTQADLGIFETVVLPDRVETIWVGAHITTDIFCDLQLTTPMPQEKAVETIQIELLRSGILNS